MAYHQSLTEEAFPDAAGLAAEELAEPVTEVPGVQALEFDLAASLQEKPLDFSALSGVQTDTSVAMFSQKVDEALPQMDFDDVVGLDLKQVISDDELARKINYATWKLMSERAGYMVDKASFADALRKSLANSKALSTEDVLLLLNVDANDHEMMGLVEGLFATYRPNLDFQEIRTRMLKNISTTLSYRDLLLAECEKNAATQEFGDAYLVEDLTGIWRLLPKRGVMEDNVYFSQLQSAVDEKILRIRQTSSSVESILGHPCLQAETDQGQRYINADGQILTYTDPVTNDLHEITDIGGVSFDESGSGYSLTLANGQSCSALYFDGVNFSAATIMDGSKVMVVQQVVETYTIEDEEYHRLVLADDPDREYWAVLTDSGYEPLKTTAESSPPDCLVTGLTQDETGKWVATICRGPSDINPPDAKTHVPLKRQVTLQNGQAVVHKTQQEIDWKEAKEAEAAKKEEQAEKRANRQVLKNRLDSGMEKVGETATRWMGNFWSSLRSQNKDRKV